MCIFLLFLTSDSRLFERESCHRCWCAAQTWWQARRRNPTTLTKSYIKKTWKKTRDFEFFGFGYQRCNLKLFRLVYTCVVDICLMCSVVVAWLLLMASPLRAEPLVKRHFALPSISQSIANNTSVVSLRWIDRPMEIISYFIIYLHKITSFFMEM